MPVVTVPGQGDVEFPDSMDDAAIVAAIKKMQPAEEKPGILMRALRASVTPFKAMEPIAAQQKATAGQGLVGKDSGDAMAALGTFTTGIPGAQQGSEETSDRLDKYAKENPWKARLLRLGGGFAVPGSLPGAAGGVSRVREALAGTLEKGAISTTRRVLRNVGGSISAKKPLSDEAALEVLDEGIIKPLGSSAGTAQRLNTAREAVGEQYRRILQALKAKGFEGPEAEAMAQKYAAEGSAANANTMNSEVTGVYKNAADQLRGKPTINGRLDLEQAENLKRSLQDQAKAAYQQLKPGEVGRAHEDAASMMRQAVEDEIAGQAKNAAPETQAIAAQFEPVKQQAGRLIEASDVANVGMARARNRNLVSLTDVGAAMGEQAHGGNLLKSLLAGAGAHLLKSRGPSTAAWAMHGGANILAQEPQALRLAALLALLRENKSEAP